MPAIVLRTQFVRLRRRKWSESLLADFMSSRFKKLAPELFISELCQLLSYGTSGNTENQEDAEYWKDRLLNSFSFGTSGEVKIGMLRSLYTNCCEFWIVSTQLSKCIEGRRWIMKNLPSIRNLTLRKTHDDYLYIEGGTEINREKIFRNYLFKSGLNAGLFVNFLVLLSRSLYDFYTLKNAEIVLPFLVFAVWLIALTFTYLYDRGRVLYIVKEK